MGRGTTQGQERREREVAGLKFGEASVLDLNKLHTEWYDWTMKSGKKPEFLKKRVAYYVVGAGAENWKYADSLESDLKREAHTLSRIEWKSRERVSVWRAHGEACVGRRGGQMDVRSARHAAGGCGT